MSLMERVASERVLGQAFDWLCQRRRNYSANDDVWVLRERWESVRAELRDELLAGRYQLAPLRRVHFDDDSVEIWAAADALVLKAVAIVLGELLTPLLSDRCFHLAGRGGAKGAVRDVRSQPRRGFVFRTDVKSYYATIDHDILLAMLAEYVDDARVLDLCRQYLCRTICDGGRYEQVDVGIALGCPLSPLMGALYLKPIDDAMEGSGCYYARFMDDWVVISSSHWKLRRAIRDVNQILARLRLRKHPEKTFVGRVERGFEFLGYAFTPGGLRIARQAIQRCAERAARLYEQGADWLRIGRYLQRWQRWTTAGLAGCDVPTADCVARIWRVPVRASQ